MAAVGAYPANEHAGVTGATDDGPCGSVRDKPERSRSQGFEEARTIALRSLEASAKTRAQLAQRLKAGGVADDVASDVLDRFESVGLVDDAAFAREWVRTRHASRGLARRALRQELTARGIAPDLIEAALSQISVDDERAAARRLADRLLPKMEGLDRVTVERRLAGRLWRRGYSVETVRTIVADRLE